MIVASFHHYLTTWAPLASWAVALGTGWLGWATWRLGTKAQTETETVRKQTQAVLDQVDLERQQLEASQRPVVLPITDGWQPGMFFPTMRPRSPTPGTPPEPWVMLSNAGAGPAINIRGALYWHGGIGGGWQVIPTSIGAGEHIPTPLETYAGHEVKWAEAEGYVSYSDLAGAEWQTRFRYTQNTAGRWSVEVTAVGKASDLGEPQYVSD